MAARDDAARHVARILDDMEGLALRPTEVARQARRLRGFLADLGVALPELPPVEADNFGRPFPGEVFRTARGGMLATPNSVEMRWIPPEGDE
jgi:hypothetical protein